jgi:PQQ-like domain
MNYRWPRPGRRSLAVLGGVLIAALVVGVALARRADPGPPAGGALRRTGALAPSAGAWPQAGHDGRRSSAVPTGVTGPRTGRQRWQRELEGAVSAGAVIGADGSVLVGSNGGTLHALDPATGRDRWTFDGGGGYGSDLSTSAAVLADGTILWPGSQDSLWALDPRGRALWHERLGGQVLSPAVAGDGRVYVCDAVGGVLALDVRGDRHDVAWRYDLGERSYSSPTISPTGTIVVGTEHQLVGLQDRGDRARRAWRWATPATLEVSAGVGPDGTSVVGLNDRWTYGVDDHGRLRWRFFKGDWSYSSAVVTADGRAWVGSHLGMLDVLASGTGRGLARLSTRPPPGRFATGKGIWTSAAVDSGGQSYVGTAPGYVVGFGADGRLLFDVRVGGTVAGYPALGPDGTLYIGSQDGVLHAFADG